ncbi:MAG: hypothetical protein MR543_03370 [Robinsoniella sp.]|nr:hypothetical protein [Robinsoniella sp.]
MEQTEKKQYALDNSAVIHMASKRKHYTNSFRISVTLTEQVCPVILQKALEHIMARFPTIIAGIKRGDFEYEVVPVNEPPVVCLDQEYLADMGEDTIQACAMRILYREKKISAEIFHALTDGYGGLVFMRALMMEYFCLKYGMNARKTEKEWAEESGDGEEKVRDDFLTYAGTKTAHVNHRKVYGIPDEGGKEKPKINVMTGIYSVQEVLEIAHRFGVSLTTFLTAVMAASVIEMEKRRRDEENYETIQIMVPVNLRKRFPSVSVRNFSLYALPYVEPCEFQLPFGTLVKKINERMSRELSREHLTGMISTNVKLQKMRLVRSIPLKVREALLRFCFRFFGERNSCLTLSNLGEVSFPDEIQRYMERVEVILSPRRNAPYNCGVVSYQGNLYINFSRKAGRKELEEIFFENLAVLGCSGKFELDGKVQ